MNIEMIKYPTNEDWLFCKQCALNTIGKNTTNIPNEEWKQKIIESEHSPIRTLWFAFRLEIPYWVSVHYTRHKFGVEHFVSTQRDDRNINNTPRAEKPQGELVSHIIYVNAQELINMSHKRLCNQASKETREVMQEIVKLVNEKCPYMKTMLHPNCGYRNGKCTEFYPCNKNNS